LPHLETRRLGNSSSLHHPILLSSLRPQIILPPCPSHQEVGIHLCAKPFRFQSLLSNPTETQNSFPQNQASTRESVKVAERIACMVCCMTFHPRLSPLFSGRLSSNWTEALAPPCPWEALKVPASWNTNLRRTGACTFDASFGIRVTESLRVRFQTRGVDGMGACQGNKARSGGVGRAAAVLGAPQLLERAMILGGTLPPSLLVPHSPFSQLNKLSSLKVPALWKRKSQQLMAEELQQCWGQNIAGMLVKMCGGTRLLR
jgi:hypothetical protein